MTGFAEKVVNPGWKGCRAYEPKTSKYLRRAGRDVD